MSIDYDDFGKLDLRVAKILTVEKIPGKSRIVKGEIDLGEEKRNVIKLGAPKRYGSANGLVIGTHVIRLKVKELTKKINIVILDSECPTLLSMGKLCLYDDCEYRWRHRESPILRDTITEKEGNTMSH